MRAGTLPLRSHSGAVNRGGSSALKASVRLLSPGAAEDEWGSGGEGEAAAQAGARRPRTCARRGPEVEQLREELEDVGQEVRDVLG